MREDLSSARFTNEVHFVTTGCDTDDLITNDEYSKSAKILILKVLIFF